MIDCVKIIVFSRFLEKPHNFYRILPFLNRMNGLLLKERQFVEYL